MHCSTFSAGKRRRLWRQSRRSKIHWSRGGYSRTCTGFDLSLCHLSLQDIHRSKMCGFVPRGQSKVVLPKNSRGILLRTLVIPRKGLCRLCPTSHERLPGISSGSHVPKFDEFPTGSISSLASCSRNGDVFPHVKPKGVGISFCKIFQLPDWRPQENTNIDREPGTPPRYRRGHTYGTASKVHDVIPGHPRAVCIDAGTIKVVRQLAGSEFTDRRSSGWMCSQATSFQIYAFTW